jgi:hypothetical protein
MMMARRERERNSLAHKRRSTLQPCQSCGRRAGLQHGGASQAINHALILIILTIRAIESALPCDLTSRLALILSHRLYINAQVASQTAFPK